MGITPQQFSQMQERLQGTRRAPTPVMSPALTPRSASASTIILGIDPSLRGTGYGVIRTGRQPVALTHGTISCPARLERSRCLGAILSGIRSVIAEHKPVLCVVEGLFFAQNLQTALIMGEARGAALAAVAEAGLEAYEIAPRKVKQAIVGYGGAQKLAVAKMIQRLLQLDKEPEPDAADALALAVTYAQETSRYNFNAPKKV
jgi:crossover junction endodeoxyribonuclease RuvC